MKRGYLLGGVLIVTAAALAWVFTRAAPPSQVSQPIAARTPAPDPSAPPRRGSAIDPASIPAPPNVDLINPPTWSRNPFAARSPAAPAPQARVQTAVAPALADPVVRSILFSAQRRAAIVDNRIVGIGDHVTAGQVVEIERDAVVIETSSGERRRLPLNGRSRTGGGK